MVKGIDVGLEGEIREEEEVQVWYRGMNKREEKLELQRGRWGRLVVGGGSNLRTPECTARHSQALQGIRYLAERAFE